ncbi:MAG: hypothetical protein KC933_31635 [Myxococcales bacterium]|nr:hypothetical protein [Myxococcales bacterium]MCB9646580.1 hypothetical protein [Deltaproteobacteria bacterium]
MRKLSCVLLAPLALAACGGGTGNLAFTTYGEDFIEVGIPAAPSPDDEGVVDGWSVRYDKFLIVLSDLEVDDDEGASVVGDPTERVFDMTRRGPHAVAAFSELPAGTFREVAVTVKKASGAVAGNATSDDVALMNTAGYSVYVEGEATKGGVTKSFAWGFDTQTRYAECEDADGALGVVIPTGGEAQLQLTIHGDHLFYDDLQSPDAVIRFEAIAGADVDDDGKVTLAEVGAVDLTALPEGEYGTGGDGSVQDLQAFLRDLTRTFVHFQGEGHCHAERL